MQQQHDFFQSRLKANSHSAIDIWWIGIGWSLIRNVGSNLDQAHDRLVAREIGDAARRDGEHLLTDRAWNVPFALVLVDVLLDAGRAERVHRAGQDARVGEDVATYRTFDQFTVEQFADLHVGCRRSTAGLQARHQCHTFEFLEMTSPSTHPCPQGGWQQIW